MLCSPASRTNRSNYPRTYSHLDDPERPFDLHTYHCEGGTPHGITIYNSSDKSFFKDPGSLADGLDSMHD